jgi:DNA-binding Lrp family transcriptional regulator
MLVAMRTGSDSKEMEKGKNDEVRLVTYPELASMMHGLLFAYQKVFINLFGNDSRKLYPYIMEELSHVLVEGENPIIDSKRSLDENVKRCISFISNEEFLKDLKFEQVGENRYMFEVGECSFGTSGVHEILKIKEGICPFALMMATCLSELNPQGYVTLNPSEFDTKGSKTYMETVPMEEGRSEFPMELTGQVRDELLSNIRFRTPIDELDMRIIRELRGNGRKPNVDIAKALDTSESTVRRRVNLLLERGIIKGFTTMLSYDPKGSVSRAFVSIKVEPAFMDEISKYLSRMKETCSVYKTIGKHNLVAELVFGNSALLQEFIDGLQYMEGVTDVEFYLASSAPKPCPWYGF